jgi:hypothetical protein
MMDLLDYDKMFQNMIKFHTENVNQAEEHLEEEKKERKKPKKRQDQIFDFKKK